MVDVNRQYQEFIYKSRYSRWLYDEERRETRDETTSRYVGFFAARIPAKLRSATCKLIYDAIYKMEVMPSMRAMMTAGPALEKDNAAGYNCFIGSEKFLTIDGIKSFSETAGTAQQVLNSRMHWVTASIKDFGIQEIQTVILKPTREINGRSRTKLRQKITVTPNHRWLTKLGETENLQEGDMIPFGESKTQSFNAQAWIAGFGFGDGTIEARGRAKVRLCGKKDAKWLPIFEKYGNSSICYPPSCNGDAIIIFHVGHMTNWKKLPTQTDVGYLTNWLNGYIAADGHSNPVQPGISSQSNEAIKFVEQIAPLCGYLVTGKNTCSVVETNFGRRKNPLQRLTLRTTGWFIVEKIKKHKNKEKVYCAIEPITKTFTLACGALTGNCSYLAVNNQRAFDEAMYLSMCGTGVGFSVERQYIADLPMVAENFYKSDTVIRVKDSKISWSSAFKELIAMLYTGMIPKWDLSLLRPAGAPLKTFGGRSSGPGPLDELFKFTVAVFQQAAGRKLRSIECHDIMTKIGDIVVVGGVRRSAMLSLSNLSDDRMRSAKTGEWYNEQPHRRLANNSAVYTEKPDIGIFMKEWLSLYDSKSGERGIFNRQAATNQAKLTGRRKFEKIDFGTNPCGEILLRDMGFCNLTEVVIRPTDTLKTLKRKVKIAAIIGSLQSTLTDFRYLRAGWKKNAEEERLLGVSLTGICDNPLTASPTPKFLEALKKVAMDTNKEWAKRLGIQQSVAVTCVKPSGTVSQLVDSSSGIHPRYDAYFIRGVRQDKKDPISTLLKNNKVPQEDDNSKPAEVDVFYFPVKSPLHAKTRLDITAIDQLELYLKYRLHWCEHNPSTTVYVKENEWLKVGAWVYEHFDEICGVSFLPHSEHIYKQAPYTPITKEEYELAVEKFPTIDWTQLSKLEKDDRTRGAQELACSGNSCEF